MSELVYVVQTSIKHDGTDHTVDSFLGLFSNTIEGYEKAFKAAKFKIEKELVKAGFPPQYETRHKAGMTEILGKDTTFSFFYASIKLTEIQ